MPSTVQLQSMKHRCARVTQSAKEQCIAGQI